MDQTAIVQELYNRIGTLPPDKAAVVSELAKRLNLAPQTAPADPNYVPDAAAQAAASNRALADKAINSANDFTRVPTNPYIGVPTAPAYQVNPSQASGLLASPDRGGEEMKQGTAQVANAHSAREVAGGVHRVISGAGEAVKVPAIAAGLVTNLPGTVAGLAAGTLAQSGVSAGAKAIGVPDEYADLAGDAAGLAAGAKVGASAEELAGKVPAAVDTARGSSADSLRASARKDIEGVLNPTTNKNKALVRNLLADGILDRDIKATSLQNLSDKAHAAAEKYGAMIDDVFDQHAQAGTKLSADPIIARLENAKQDYVVDGVSIRPAYVDQLTELQKQIETVAKNNGGDVPVASLRRIKQIHDEQVAQSAGGFALPVDDASRLAAIKEYANGIRGVFADGVPELADPSKEFHFHQSLADVVDATLQRKTGQKPTISKTVLENAGMLAGAKLGGPVGVLVGRKAGGAVADLENSAFVKTRLANLKDALADFLEPDTTTPAQTAGTSQTAAPVASSAVSGSAPATPVQPTATRGAVQAPATGAGAAGVGAGTSGNASGAGNTLVSVPGRPGASYPAQYEFRELANVNASHNGYTFSPNPKYQLQNQRDYSNAANQVKIVQASMPAAFNPDYLTVKSPDATAGAPVIDAAGNVLSGNGRKMIADRVYNGRGAAKIKQAMVDAAAGVGADPATVAAMQRPILVRVVPDEAFARPGFSKQNAIADFNQSGTGALTPAERAISDSQRVSPETLDDLAARLDARGPDATLSDVLGGKAGADVLDKLIADGVVTLQERPALATDAGLTKAGRDRVASLMIGRYFDSPEQLDSIAPSVRQKVERLAAPLAKVDTLADWSLTPHLRDAISILEKAQNAGIKNVSDYLSQDGLFGKDKYSPETVALAKALASAKSADLVAAIKQYAGDAHFAAGGSSMFGETPTPASSFADSIGKVKSGAQVEAEKLAAKFGKKPAN